MAVKTFTTGEVLTAADTNTYLNNGGLVYVAQTVFSATNTPFINGCFDGTFDQYRIVLTSGASVSTDVRVRLRYSTSTVETGAVYDRYGYYYSTVINGWNAANQTSAYAFDIFGGTTEQATATFDIFNPYTTKHTNISLDSWSDSSGYLYRALFRVETTTQYTGFQISADSGTLTGQMQVYGYRKG